VIPNHPTRGMEKMCSKSMSAKKPKKKHGAHASSTLEGRAVEKRLLEGEVAPGSTAGVSYLRTFPKAVQLDHKSDACLHQGLSQRPPWGGPASGLERAAG